MRSAPLQPVSRPYQPPAIPQSDLCHPSDHQALGFLRSPQRVPSLSSRLPAEPATPNPSERPACLPVTTMPSACSDHPILPDSCVNTEYRSQKTEVGIVGRLSSVRPVDQPRPIPQSDPRAFQSPPCPRLAPITLTSPHTFLLLLAPRSDTIFLRNFRCKGCSLRCSSVPF
jgi:hypothetical protein